MNDIHDGRQDDEMMRYWRESTLDARDPEQLLKELSAQVTSFDRTIFWRNSREYAAGLVVLAWAAYGALKGNKPSIAMAVGILFVMVYMWSQHRKAGTPDPSADSVAYRRALVDRFDRQIRLLKRVKYWYLLPLYLPIVWWMAETWPRAPWSAGITLAIVTAAFGFIGWLNERLAVQNLEQARAVVQAALDKAEP